MCRLPCVKVPFRYSGTLPVPVGRLVGTPSGIAADFTARVEEKVGSWNFSMTGGSAHVKNHFLDAVEDEVAMNGSP